MPVGVVKSKSDEKAWDAAKEAAGKSHDKDDTGYWPIVMSIYKKMTGRKDEAQAMVMAVQEGADPGVLIGRLCEATNFRGHVQVGDRVEVVGPPVQSDKHMIPSGAQGVVKDINKRNYWKNMLAIYVEFDDKRYGTAALVAHEVQKVG
jgi:hypothetical protein